MIEELFNEWKKRYSDVAKLQWIYVASAIALVTVAGVIALLNQSVSQNVLNIASMLSLVFFVNLVVWAVVGPVVRTKHVATAKRSRK